MVCGLAIASALSAPAYNAVGINSDVAGDLRIRGFHDLSVGAFIVHETKPPLAGRPESGLFTGDLD